MGLEPEDEDLRQRADGGDQPGQRKHDPGNEVKSYENIIKHVSMKTVLHNLKSRHPEVKEVGAHLVLLVLALGAGGRSKCVIMFNYESLSESCDSVISSFNNVYFH